MTNAQIAELKRLDATLAAPPSPERRAALEVDERFRASMDLGGGVTPAQIAEMTRLSEALKAHPDKQQLVEERALLLAQCGVEFERIVASLREFWKGDINLDVALTTARQRWVERHGDPQWRVDAAQARVNRAFVAALYQLLIERHPTLQSWLERQSCVSNYFSDAVAAETENADAERMKTWPSEELKLRALALALRSFETRREQTVVGLLWTQALRADAAAGHISASYDECLRWSEDETGFWFVRVAWLGLAVEARPDDAELRVRRARLWRHAGSWNAPAQADMSHAIALAPRDPQFYETRAELMAGGSSPDDLWDNFLDRARDYRVITELAIEAGAIGGDAPGLRERGDAEMKSGERYNFYRGHVTHAARAVAYYSAAIELAPDDATLYLARAQALAGHNGSRREVKNQRTVDYARALARDETLDEARAHLVERLSQDLRRRSGHERVEGLLRSREVLAKLGLKPGLARQVIAQVERALAA